MGWQFTGKKLNEWGNMGKKKRQSVKIQWWQYK